MSNEPPQPPSEGPTAILSEREKWEREIGFRERELRLKEREHELKIEQHRLAQQEPASTGWRSPLVVAILAATIAAVGNAGVALTNGISQRRLEDEKAEQARILEMVRNVSKDKAAENLAFLINIGLVSNKIQVAKLADFLAKRRADEEAAMPDAAGNREVHRNSYHSASVQAGERAVHFQIREINNDPDKDIGGNHPDLRLDGEAVEYADESTWEQVKSVGAKPQTIKLTGRSLKGDYLEITVEEQDFTHKPTYTKVYKQPVSAGEATFAYTTHEVDLEAIIKSNPSDADTPQSSGARQAR